MFTKRNRAYTSTVKRVLSGTDGSIFLKYLQENYLNTSGKKDTVENTYYFLGKQDLVRDLIRVLDSSDKLDNVNTISYSDTEEGA